MIIKNLNPEEIVLLNDQIAIQKGQIVSKTLIQNAGVSITLFAFDKNEEISTHESSGDALVTVLEGKAQIIIDGEAYILNDCQSILMPANKPHSVYGTEAFKMMLTVVF